jgi:hypothetical protein
MMDTAIVTDGYVKDTAMKRWGLSPKKTGQAHWNSPCFRCGGTDRMYFMATGYYRCNQCGICGWLDEDRKDFKADPALMQHYAEENAWRKSEQDALNKKWQEGYRAGYWKGFHDGMAQANRAWWWGRGITEYQIDYYGLGYTPNKKILTAQGEMTLPAYTIPIREPDTQEVINTQYRIADPPSGVAKYRQERGITAAAFYADARTDEMAIVLEGAIKAMVVYNKIDGAMQVVGLPGCTPGEIVLDKLKSFSRIYLVLDPGCRAQAERIKARLPQTRIANLAEKPDDALLSGLGVAQFREVLRQAW